MWFSCNPWHDAERGRMGLPKDRTRRWNRIKVVCINLPEPVCS